MSSFEVLREVSSILKEVLAGEFAADPAFTAVGIRAEEISFSNPTQCLADGHGKLSLWLYKVDEDSFTRNAPATRSVDGEGIVGPPLTLELSYLVTPLLGKDEDLRLLGKVLEVLHRRPMLPIDTATSCEDLRISARRLTLEELTRVWEALREPYRLSVCYQVRVTHIHGPTRKGAGRIRDRRPAGSPR